MAARWFGVFGLRTWWYALFMTRRRLVLVGIACGCMRLRKHSSKVLALAGVVVLLLTIAFLTLSSRPSSAVTLTFLYTTNHAQFGKAGVFRLVNHLNESLSSSAGHYKPASRSGLSDRGTTFRGGQFSAATTNIIQMWIPTNGGPYKLVLYCLPASKTTPAFYRSARVRIVTFLSPWVQPSFATQARWYGTVFAESQSFETSP